MKIIIYCGHPETNRRHKCKLIDVGVLNDFWFKCPRCKKEIGFKIVS